MDEKKDATWDGRHGSFDGCRKYIRRAMRRHPHIIQSRTSTPYSYQATRQATRHQNHHLPTLLAFPTSPSTPLAPLRSSNHNENNPAASPLPTNFPLLSRDHYPPRPPPSHPI